MRKVLACTALLIFALSTLALADGAYLGVYLREGSEEAKGAVIEKVVPDTPAEKAGLKPGDRIVGAGKEEVTGPQDLQRIIGGASPGDSLELKVARGEETLSLTVTLGSQPAEEAAPAKESKPKSGFLGVAPAPVDPALAAHFGLEEDVGISIWHVLDGTPAAKAGLRTNDIIVSVDGKPIRGPEDFVEKISRKAEGDRVQLEVIQSGARKTIEVTLGARPPEKDLGPAPFPGRLPFGLPRWDDGRDWFGRRGRVILRGPDGSKLFELPKGFWEFEKEPWDFDVDKFFGELEKRFPDLGKISPEDEIKDLKQRLRKLLDTVREGEKGDWSVKTQTIASSVVRVVEDDLDITVRDENGVRTVDVKKGGETICENLPYEKIGSLPPDIRDRVEKVARGIKVQIEGVKPKPFVPRPEKQLRT